MKKPAEQYELLPELGYRPKSDWTAVGAADAFANLPDRYSLLVAQRKFHAEVEKAVKTAEQFARNKTDIPALRVKVQLSPSATNLPSGFSAWASVGMTAFLQFARHAQDLKLSNYIHKYLSAPSDYDPVQAAPQAYQALVGCISKIVQARIFFSAISKHPDLNCVESYRLFMASIQPRFFASIEQTVSHAILYSDLIFPDQTQYANSAIAAVAKISSSITAPLLVEMDLCNRSDLRACGTKLLKSLSASLANFLPEKTREDPNAEKTEPGFANRKPIGGIKTPLLSNDQSGKTGKGKQGSQGNGENVPILQEEAEKIDPTDQDATDAKQLDDLLNAALEQSKIDIPRSEIIESQLRTKAFADGPLEGAIFSGHEVRVKIGENRAFGELFSRVIRQKRDLQNIDELSPMVRVVARTLRQLCYPSLCENAANDKFKASGRLDGSRLSAGAFSEAIFKRYKSIQTPDPSGDPVLLLCCDGSASFSENQMTMLKIISSAWILASGYAGVKLLAALYHSDKIRPGLSAPVVKWIYHPDKTFAFSRQEAVSHVLSMPKKGTGKQADALSLAYLIDHAKEVAKGKNIYLVLLSDCAWNKSFSGDQTGHQEVSLILEKSARELGDLLHTTLIGLGIEWETGFELPVDEIMLFGPDKLKNPESIVSVLARHTAKMVRQREKQMETA